MRAQGILRLREGLTLRRTADEVGVHLNSVEQWCERWSKLGLAGLYKGRHTCRLRKWTPQQQLALGELAQSERYLKRMDFTYKRYRYSLKKRNQEGVRARQQSDRGGSRARSRAAMGIAVFRRIRFQSESLGALQLEQDRSDGGQSDHWLIGSASTIQTTLSVRLSVCRCQTPGTVPHPSRRQLAAVSACPFRYVRP